tara:strand:- start:1531 stop:2865 length:1335 start_codon:yes stop_codon:yes gene_type:complete
MSIRETTEAHLQGTVPIDKENASDAILEIPSCTIEDIDRAVFDLFDRDLPIHYTYKKKTKRVPVVFAAGERFALIARKKPLRDKNNALILPVVSMMRQGVVSQNEMGLASNQSVPHIIKKKLSKKDARYQRIVNKLGLVSSDDLPTQAAFITTGSKAYQNAQPGRIASRRAGSLVPLGVRRGNLLDLDNKNNIFEVIEMPPVQFITATYEVTIWAQYIQQMNDIEMAIMSNMQSYGGRTFRLETKKGYTFVAYLESNFDPGNNFDDFTDDERIIRTSFTLKVPGYLLGETYPGAPNRLRSTTSAPQLTFGMNFVNGEIENQVKNSNIPSGDPNDYILDDRNINAPLPGQSIAGARSRSSTDPRHPGVTNFDQEDTALIGGASNDIVSYPAFVTGSQEKGGSGTPVRTTVLENEVNPFTGDNEDVRSYVKTRTSRKGEVVYREVI